MLNRFYPTGIVIKHPVVKLLTEQRIFVNAGTVTDSQTFGKFHTQKGRNHIELLFFRIVNMKASHHQFESQSRKGILHGTNDIGNPPV